MFLDPLDTFVKPRQRNAVPYHRRMILMQSQSQLSQPGGNVIDFSAVLIEQFGNLIKSAVMRSDLLRHLGEELVNRREVDAVAALHCGKKDTPSCRRATARTQTGRLLRANRVESERNFL